ncbi:MAG: T9SS type A sorting domain-containing protein [Ignavibacteriae bacterium]|nr:T9SS type A sorting domain-containing protein [Ignavibacteriota bacterium]
MRRVILLSAMMLVSASMFAQLQWRYSRALTFPPTDTAFVRPYLCTVTSTGRVYVLSSTVTDAAAHNAIYYADSNATTLTRMIDYYVIGASDTLTGDIGNLRGIASAGRDILINASVPFRRSAPNTVGMMYYYPNGDTALVQKYGFYSVPQSAGHGTYHHGIALTKDTIGFAGLSFNTQIRFYNFKYAPISTGTARGSWINATYAVEPGGPNTGGFDIVRDCAVNPASDYNDSTKVWYTSRNSLSSTQVTGGIAQWSRGRQITNPGGYQGQRVQDAFGLLVLGSSISYGITVDRNGLLWVAGNDSTRRWVKAFDLSAGIFANEVFELPSSNSIPNPVPGGAPFINPVDIGLTPNGTIAYVPDASQKKVYVFKYGTTDVGESGDRPIDFRLEQNFPNPFNPTTTISFSLSKASSVKLVVTNMLGEEVATLVDGKVEPGKHVKVFDAEKLASGVYFYRMIAGEVSLARKMMLVR